MVSILKLDFSKILLIVLISLLIPSCDNQTTDTSIIIKNEPNSCGRTVRNLLSSTDISLFTWGAVPNKQNLVFSKNQQKATFDLINSADSRLFIAKNILLRKNTKYALRIDVTNFRGQFENENFVIVGANDSEFTGKTSTQFIKNGNYGLVFSYNGEDRKFLIRMGIGTIKNDILATNDGNSHFTIEKIMLEVLPNEDNSPSEYVSPNNNWGFDYKKANIYDNNTGLITEKTNSTCGKLYNRGWVITADSFGNDASDFPNQLSSNIAKNYAFYIDAVPGRTLSTALINYTSLINLQTYPPNIAKPYGTIIQGGINDVISDSTFSDMQETIQKYISISKKNNLKIIIFSISPFKNNNNWNMNREAVRVAYNDWLINTISLIPDIFIYDISQNINNEGLADKIDIEILAPEYDGSNPILFDGDGLHPNLTGSRKIANEIKKIMDNQIAVDE